MVSTALRDDKIWWDVSSLHKYDVQGPRYTSYPTANHFRTSFSEQHYRTLARAEQPSIAPISLYVHVPFCANVCYYCACNKVVTRKRDVVRPFLDNITREARLRGELHHSRPVAQLHLGGGTPTFLDPAELTELLYMLGNHFKLVDSDSREYSIEIDPRTVSRSIIALLKGLGFNRISMGIQDFDPAVQAAVNRRQPFEMVAELTATIRDLGFKSLSFDLIYGLPLQTVAGFADTLEKVVALNPDRIACYNYAHLPERFPSQRAIARLDLPGPDTKLSILQFIGERLLAAGYDYIGMDHFVKPGDELGRARHEGRLQRNFQGYSTCLASDLVGLGPSAISEVANAYSQNARDLEHYYRFLAEDRLPIICGLEKSFDDRLRHQVIMDIACRLELDFGRIEQAFTIDFEEYFAAELRQLRLQADDGLVTLESGRIRVTDKGRMLLRNVCMVFDAYLGGGPTNRIFSRTI